MTTPLPGHLGRLPAAVQEAMRVSVEAGALGPADLDPSVVAKLAELPEAAAKDEIESVCSCCGVPWDTYRGQYKCSGKLPPPVGREARE